MYFFFLRISLTCTPLFSCLSAFFLTSEQLYYQQFFRPVDFHVYLEKAKLALFSRFPSYFALFFYIVVYGEQKTVKQTLVESTSSVPREYSRSVLPYQVVKIRLSYSPHIYTSVFFSASFFPPPPSAFVDRVYGVCFYTLVLCSFFLLFPLLPSVCGLNRCRLCFHKTASFQ